MMCNVGGVDRVVRILVGVVLTGGAIFLIPNGATKISLLVVAALSFASAWFGFCFINKMMNFNTAKPQPIQQD